MNAVGGKLSDGEDSSSNFSDSSTWSEAMEISDDEIDFHIPAQVAIDTPSSDPTISTIKSRPSVHPSSKRTVAGACSLRQNNQLPRHRSTSPIKRSNNTRIVKSLSPPQVPIPRKGGGGKRGRSSVARSVSPTRTGGPRMSVRVQHRPKSPPKKKVTRVSPLTSSRTPFSRQEVTPIHFTPRIREVSPLPKSNSLPEDMNRAGGSNKVKYKTSTSPKRGKVVVPPKPPKRSSGGAAPALTPKITPKGGGSKKKRSLTPKNTILRSKSDDLSPLQTSPKKAIYRRNRSLDTILIDEIMVETDVAMGDEKKNVEDRQKKKRRSWDKEISAITLSPELSEMCEKNITGSKIGTKPRPLPSRANNNTGTLNRRSGSPKPAVKPIRRKSNNVKKKAQSKAAQTGTTPEQMVETVESDGEHPQQPTRIRSRSLDREPSALTLFPSQFQTIPKRNSTGSDPVKPRGVKKARRPRSSTPVKRRNSPIKSSPIDGSASVVSERAVETVDSEEETHTQKPSKPRSRSLDREPSAVTLFPSQLSQQQAATATTKSSTTRVSTSTEKPNSKSSTARSLSTPPPIRQQRLSGKAKTKQTFKERPRSGSPFMDTVLSPKTPSKPTTNDLRKPERPRSPLSFMAVSSTSSDCEGEVRKHNHTGSSPPHSNRAKSRSGTAVLIAEADVPIGDIGQRKSSPNRGRNCAQLRSTSPRRTSQAAGNSPQRRSVSPYARRKDTAPGAVTMSGLEVADVDRDYQYRMSIRAKSPGQNEPRRYRVRTRQWSRRDRLIEFKQGSVLIGNKEIEIQTPPKSLVIIWVVMGTELITDLIATAISFVSFLRAPIVCCGEEIKNDALHLGITIPFILLIIAEIGFLVRAIFLSLWPKSTYTLDGGVTISDEEVADADRRGIGKTLCCIDWSPKSIFWTVNLLTIINPFFGFFITWILLYESDKNEALAVMGIESASIVLHFVAVHLERSAPTLKLKCLHMLAIVAWMATIIITLLYLQQGGVCYNSKVNNFWLDGCELCPDGSVPIDDNGLKCPFITVLSGKNITNYTPVFSLTLQHDTICKEDLQMCWYTY